MKRRTFATILLGTATGCTSSETAPATTSVPTTAPSTTATKTSKATTATTTRSPANFKLEGYTVPERVEIGEEFTPEITIRNIGGQTGTYQEPLYYRYDGETWEEGGNWTFRSVQPGESVTAVSSEPWQFDYMRRLDIRLGDFGGSATVQSVSAKIPFGDNYIIYGNVRFSVYAVEFRDTYLYEQSYTDGSTETIEAPAGEGEQWMFVWVTAENVSGTPVNMPITRNIVVLTGDQGGTQFDYERIHKEKNRYKAGRVQPGVTREGWIAYKVPSSLTKTGVFAVVWSQSTAEGDIAVHWKPKN